MIRLRITDNSQGVVAELRLGRQKIADTLPLMKNISEVVVASVRENFEVGGRPAWKPLALATIKRKGHSKPLFFSGALSQIVWQVTRTTVLIGVQPRAKAYARIQQLGGRAGRGRKVTIPARPYMVLQAEDTREIEALAQKHVEDSLGRK